MEQNPEYWANKNEKQADGSKLHEERLTIMVCANSTGCHKIPILGIGKSRSPRGFPKEPGQLPTYYSHSAKAWMTQAIFVEWYETIFIPTVKEYQASQNRSRERESFCYWIMLPLIPKRQHSNVKMGNSEMCFCHRT